ncbi:putative pilus assembly protein FilE [Acinetobacter indicus]|uniref:putative pilus assembly protein FilE n=1 Tax=Acinetobacter indicus TaxID=756892 RepID=UPI000CEC2B5C|nr:putative pilus assembly protein FilE [Acinetobacter indicus]MCO8100240.1 putative pilus assembly protein FilE [Acinetobacter indicus]MCO8105754.1 putative pilus assembly protein FilE [Acinetobacter indicus]MCO8111428.1 putative pilus assembly protein FilE [Acinetobacter indicus]MDM1291831.1 putative pilus assembly protein FilE [Acinetobacter indicus]MDM1321781.1 putative pilus assembly protein FilE [Acinetobacter indicus]
MVKVTKRLSGLICLSSLWALSLGSASVSYANEFYTIIGPDGRPMVVQRKAETRPAAKKEAVPVNKTQAQSRASSALNPAQPQAQIPVSEPVRAPAVAVVPTVSTVPTQPVTTVKLTESIPQKTPDTAVVEQPVVTPVVSATTKPVSASSSPTITSVIPQTESQEVLKTVQADQADRTSSSGFTEMEGEQYVNNEYLEHSEFNLEGKKRFYMMPEGVVDSKLGGGATRVQVVEREKGVGQSVLDRLFKKRQPESVKPMVLSSTYYRIAQADAISSLGQSCFNNKKIKHAKTLAAQKDVNLWPRAPLTDEFDYEVVKLEGDLRHLQVNSYASKTRQPTFYWPFAVFLDAQGCVIEGAGGYKSQDTQSTLLQHEQVEGVIQLPAQTRYLLLTPLASAIDMENRQLSNQGQLKIIALDQ